MPRPQLRDSQLAALEILKEPGRTFGAIWAEPRSGKTAVALKWLEYVWPPVAVVVGPKVAETVWRRESAKWMDTEYRFFSLTAGNEYPSKDSLVTTPGAINIFFVNYEQFYKTPYKRLKPFLHKLSAFAKGGGAMILDESHSIKTPSSISGRNIRPLAKKFRYRLILTGTPVTNPNQIDNVYGQWTFLDPKIRDRWATAKDFREYFGEWTNYKGYPELVRPIRQYELNAYLQPNVIPMTGSGHTLNTVVAAYTPPPTVATTLKTLENDAVVSVQGRMVVGLNPLTRLLRLRTLVAGWSKDDNDEEFVYQEAARARLKALNSILKRTSGKTIICCTHLYEIRMVGTYLRKRGIKFLVITGSTLDKNRTIDKFQLGNATVLLVQPRTISMAVDISVADDLIWYTSDFNFVTYTQTSDRIKLSLNSPTVWFVKAKDTVDEDVWTILTKNHDHLKTVIQRIKSKKPKAIR